MRTRKGFAATGQLCLDGADIQTVTADEDDTENTFVLADDLYVLIDNAADFSNSPIFETDPTIGSGVNYDYREQGSIACHW